MIRRQLRSIVRIYQAMCKYMDDINREELSDELRSEHKHLAIIQKLEKWFLLRGK